MGVSALWKCFLTSFSLGTFFSMLLIWLVGILKMDVYFYFLFHNLAWRIMAIDVIFLGIPSSLAGKSVNIDGFFHKPPFLNIGSNDAFLFVRNKCLIQI
jgi:hypothetical protein